MTQIALFDKQIEFFSLNTNEALLEAGIAYGKSRTASIWLINQVQQYPKSSWFMAARDYKQLKTAVDREFEHVLNDILGIQRGVHYRKTNGSPIEYVFKHNGAIIFGVGAHNYDTVFRAGNYNGAWGDEVDFWKPEALEALRGRIRVFPELKRFTSSPKGFNHIHKDFYVNKVGPVINATTLENPTLSQSYVDSLRRTYSPKLYEQEVLAKRLNLSQGAVYDEFNRDIHVSPCKDKYDPNVHQIYFFTDYNYSNYCGCYMYYDNAEEILYTIGEEQIKFGGTERMAPIVKSKYPPAIVIGDSTGNNKKDVAITRTNYKIFEDHGLMTKRFRNPLVEQRIINANSRLFHKKIVIDPDCKVLIKDLELLGWKEDGSGIDKSNIELSHASDAWSYGVFYFMPLKANKGIKIHSQVK